MSNIKVVSADAKPVTETAQEVVESAEAKQVESVAEEKNESAENTEESDASENEAEETEAKESTEDSEEKEESEPSKDEQKKPRSGFKRRIDKLNKRLSEKEQEAEYWKQEALKSRPNQETKQEPKQKAKEGRPSADDYESYEAYEDALDNWRYSERRKAEKAEEEKSKFQSEQAKVDESFNKKWEAASEAHEDFDEVIDGVNDIRMSVALMHLLKESENGPELCYELAKNREEYARIAALNPIAAARELGKFEASLKPKAQSSAKQETKITKAPAPIKPVGSGGSSGAAKSIYDSNLSQAEYEALRAKQEARRGA